MKQIIIAASILTLAACGSNEEQTASPASEPQAEKEKDNSTDALAAKVKEAAAQAAEALKLDTSSLSAFKNSLSDMRNSLTPEQTTQLKDALAVLAKSKTKKEGTSGLLGAAKDMASGKSLDEMIYNKLGNDLNGLTFEDILAKAN